MSTYVIKIFGKEDGDEQERLQALFRYSSDAIVIIDRENNIVSINPAAQKLTGWNADEVVGRFRCVELFRCCDEKGRPLCSTSRTGPKPICSTGCMPYFEMSLATKSGERLPITASASLLPSLFQEPLVAIIMRDLSEKRKLEGELQKRRRQLETLYQVGLELSSVLDVTRNLDDVLEKVRDIFSCDIAALCLVHEHSGELCCKAMSGEYTREFRAFAITVSELLAARALKEGRPVISESFPADVIDPPEFFQFVRDDGIRAAMCVPLQLRGKDYGALLVAYRQPAGFSQDDVVFASSLAHRVAVALENVTLYEQVQNYAVIEERERLAREMHDGLAQTLTYLGTKIATAQQLLNSGGGPEAMEELETARKMLQEAHRDVRQWIFNLKTKPGNMDFVSTIRQYTSEFSRQNGITVETLAPEDGRLVLPQAVEIQLIRIIQEALANVRKHSGASRAVVEVRRSDRELAIMVKDNGRGFIVDDPASQQTMHFGLAIMRERAKSVGGIFEYSSVPGRGTVVLVKLPFIPGKEAADEQDHKSALG